VTCVDVVINARGFEQAIRCIEADNIESHLAAWAMTPGNSSLSISNYA